MLGSARAKKISRATDGTIRITDRYRPLSVHGANHDDERKANFRFNRMIYYAFPLN